MVFTVQATGTGPLSYNWQWKPAGESEEWQPCDTDFSDGAILTIPSGKKFNEGSYRCVISNCAGTQTSNPAELSIGKSPFLKFELVHDTAATFCVLFYYVIM